MASIQKTEKLNAFKAQLKKRHVDQFKHLDLLFVASALLPFSL